MKRITYDGEKEHKKIRRLYFDMFIMRSCLLVIILLVMIKPVYSRNNAEQIRISADLQLIKITDNAYVHISYMDGGDNVMFPCNGLILVNKDKAFLFDTPPDDSLTQVLLSFIRDSLKLNIVGFIACDWHQDSMGGLGAINNSGIPSYTNELTIEIARLKKLPVPIYGFKDSLVLTLGQKDILCYYLGAAHTMDNIVVWLPSEQLLFADCMIKEMNAKNLGFTGDGDLKAYPLTLARVRKKFSTARFVIPGHGAYGGIELIEHTIQLSQTK